MITMNNVCRVLIVLFVASWVGGTYLSVASLMHNLKDLQPATDEMKQAGARVTELMKPYQWVSRSFSGVQAILSFVGGITLIRALLGIFRLNRSGTKLLALATIIMYVALPGLELAREHILANLIGADAVHLSSVKPILLPLVDSRVRWFLLSTHVCLALLILLSLIGCRKGWLERDEQA